MSERDAVGGTLEQNMTVAELLHDDVLNGAELIAGSAGLERPINALNVMTVPEIGRWVRRDEFLLATGYPLPRDDAGQAELLQGLDKLGVAGIGIKLDHYMPELSQSIITAADDLGMPLVVIPERIRFDDILSRAFTTIVNRQAAALTRAQEIHSSFLDITLSGGGLRKLARKLSALLDQSSVTITDPQGVVLARAGDESLLRGLEVATARGILDVSRLGLGGVHVDPASGRRWVARQIRAGNMRHGYVVVAEGATPFGEFTMVALDQAAIVAALEVNRDLAVGAVERRFSSNVVFELITGGETEFAEGATRGAAFGWDLDREIVVLVGRNELSAQSASSTRQARLADERAIEFWSSVVRSHDRTAAAAGLGAELVAIVGADQDSLTLAKAVQAEIAQFVQGQYAIGVSRAYSGASGIAAAYQEAKMALRLGHRISGSGAITQYGQLGLFRLLAHVSDDELQRFTDETLGPVTRLNEPDRTEMLNTLKALVEHNMNMAETARHLHYHYNTLRYRLTKLERLLGPFSTNTGVTIQVCVALQIMDMQGNISHPAH